MKYNFFLASLIALTGFSLCAVNKSPSKAFINPSPTIIVLQDSGLSSSLQCTKNGAVWQVSNVAVGAYLAQVAQVKFGINNVSNFQEINVLFDSLYSKGVLVGFGTTANGVRVPIGVEYLFTSTNATGTTAYMGNTETHTCSGAPCNCCAFAYEGGKISGTNIIGCWCNNAEGVCFNIGNTQCNHTVTTTK